MTRTENGLIVIRRPPLFINKWRSYSVYLDGKKEGRIKEGETISVSAPPGIHTIWLKIDWLRSNPLQVNIAPNMTVSLIVEKNPLTGWKYWGSLIAFGLFLGIGAGLGGTCFIMFGVISLVILCSIFCRPGLREL